jgi:hypothetical protein
LSIQTVVDVADLRRPQKDFKRSEVLKSLRGSFKCGKLVMELE